MPTFSNSNYQQLEKHLLDNTAPPLLDLSNKGITDSWARLIINALRYNQSVKKVDLSNNYLTNEGAGYIRSSLTSLVPPVETNIIAITLSGNPITATSLLNDINIAVTKNKQSGPITLQPPYPTPTNTYTLQPPYPTPTNTYTLQPPSPTPTNTYPIPTLTPYNRTVPSGIYENGYPPFLTYCIAIASIIGLLTASIITGKKLYKRHKQAQLFQPDPHSPSVFFNPGYRKDLPDEIDLGDYQEPEDSLLPQRRAS